MVRYCGPIRRSSRPCFGLLPRVKEKYLHALTLYIHVDSRASRACTKTKQSFIDKSVQNIQPSTTTCILSHLTFFTTPPSFGLYSTLCTRHDRTTNFFKSTLWPRLLFKTSNSCSSRPKRMSRWDRVNDSNFGTVS